MKQVSKIQKRKFINIYSLDGQLAGSRRSKYRRHSNNQFGRLKRGSRFPSHFYNKVYIPNNWSVSYLFQINQCFFWIRVDYLNIFGLLPL